MCWTTNAKKPREVHQQMMGHARTQKRQQNRQVMPSGGVVTAKVMYERWNVAAKMQERGKEESDTPGQNRHLGHVRVRTSQGGEVKMRKVLHAGVEMGYQRVNAQEAVQVHCRQHTRD